jgi:hypothetical protein
MGRLLVALLVLVAVVVGLGVYLDWFQFSTDKGAGTYQVDLTIDKDKIKADAEKAREQAGSLGSKAKDAATPNSSGGPTTASGSSSR